MISAPPSAARMNPEPGGRNGLPPTRPPAPVLIPAIVVVLMAWIGGTMPRVDPCASVPSDGAQFACWLEHG